MPSVARSTELQIGRFQERVLQVPEQHDVGLLGGRGSSKTYAALLLIVRHIEQHGALARVLFVRRTYKGLADVENLLRDLLGRIYGTAARYNATDRVWRFPNGAYLELGQLETEADYAKYQGRSFTLLIVDEAGQYADARLLDRLRSNMRGPEHIPLRAVIIANPGDVGHGWLSQRYALRGTPWKPCLDPETGREFVYCPSTYLDNPFIDQAAYRRQLEASCAGDPELLKAWLGNDWSIARGAFFGSVLSEARNAMEPWPPGWFEEQQPSSFWPGGDPLLRMGGEWTLSLAYDHGSAAPGVAFIVARSPGGGGPDGRFYSRDSILLLDELATNRPDSLTEGLRWTIPRVALEVKRLCERWHIDPQGAADDACFAKHGHDSGSIADEFSRCGVYFEPAGKGDRYHGWEIMRRLLADAGSPDVPGLYVSRSCTYFWATVPTLARDPRRPDDLDSRGPDHAADAARYALLAEDFEPGGGFELLL